MANVVLTATLKGFEQVESALRGTATGLEHVGKTAESVSKRLKSVGGGLSQFGRSLSLRVTAPIAGAFTLAALAMDKQVKAEAQLNAVIRSTGGSANVTAEHVKALGAEIQKTTRFGDEQVIAMSNIVLTFKQIANAGEGSLAIFDRTVQATTDLAAAMGTDLQSAALQLGKALNDPIGQIGALSRTGITFTKEQKAMIKSLAESGRLAEAQALILDELESEFGGVAAALRKVGLGPLVAGFNSLGDAMEEFGKIMQPTIESFGKFLEDIAAKLQALSPETKKFLLIAAALAAALGPVLIAVGALATGAAGFLALAAAAAPAALAMAPMVATAAGIALGIAGVITVVAVVTGAFFGLTRVLSGTISGFATELMGYAPYFLVTFFLAFPAYALLPWVKTWTVEKQ